MINIKKSFVLILTGVLVFPLVCQSASFQKNLQSGQQLLQTGQINRALLILEDAYQQVQNNNAENSAKQQVSVMVTLAEANIRAQKFTQAKSWLDNSYERGQALSEAHLLAAVCHRYGLLYATQNNSDLALLWYNKALTYAQQSTDNALISSSLINVAKYQPDQAVQFLKEAYQQQELVRDKPIKRQLLLTIGYQAEQIQQTSLAQQALSKVLQLNPTTRQKAQALGYLGALYQQKKRDDEALDLTRQAIISDHSPDLLIKWEQQQARLLQKKYPQQAINAYRRAVMHIESIRQDIPIYYQNGKSSFRQTLAPVYLGLIDLLLLQQEKNTELSEKNLKQAQQIWERFKVAELNDYFRNACDIRQTSLPEWQTNNSDIAIIYPIVLPDRLEILLSIKRKISRYRIDVSSNQLANVINELLTNIEKIKPLSANKQLYQWLIQPIAEQLKSNKISTLVYIPDGILRKLPLAILNDGQQYVIEDYAVVTNPGLSMLNAQQHSIKKQKQILLSGMSTPGPVVDELIDINFFAEDSSDQRMRGVSKTLTKKQRQIQTNSIKQSLLLPKVEKELDLLASVLMSPVMKNEQFTLDNFEQAVLKGQNIIHIASHGYFSGDPESSFVMTYDRLLNINELISLFRHEALLETPVDLMTLSACQTAEGDDRSPLGLSGVVVQAGIRSAIGSLWPVDDEAAQKVFASFYQHYYTQSVNKAQALRQAQLALIKLPGFDHPIDWGGFILVGDWN